jgi:hypothetical protein
VAEKSATVSSGRVIPPVRYGHSTGSDNTAPPTVAVTRRVTPRAEGAAMTAISTTAPAANTNQCREVAATSGQMTSSGHHGPRRRSAWSAK